MYKAFIIPMRSAIIELSEMKAEAIHMPTKSMKIYAGFDCGGSNTRCLLVSEDGAILGRGKGGPSNYLFCGKEAAAEAIRTSIGTAFADAGLAVQQLEGIFVASAAVEVFCGEAHEAFFKEVTGCENVQCDSDIFPVWYAGSRLSPAVAMIAGTGAVTYLLKERSFIKASGWGPLFGDEGGGYDIGINAVRITARMADRRIPMDEEFYRAVMTHFEVDPDTPRRLLRAVNQGDHRKRAASVTEVVSRLCESGNPTAAGLMKNAADELALSVQTVVSQAEGSFSLLLAGSLLTNETPLRRMLIEKASEIGQIDRIVTPETEAVVSAAALALRAGGKTESAEHLMKSGGSLC